MDVNGTRYHLITGSRDWLPALAATTTPAPERLVWDPRRRAVTLRHELFLFPARGSEAVLTPADRRGAACDRFGHLYWIGPERDEIRYRPADAAAAATFWRVAELGGEATAPCHPFPGCAPAAAGPRCGEFGPLPPAPAAAPPPVLSGLAVTDRHFLVVGTLAPGGLLVFDLHGGGPPVWLRWPAAVPFAPFDLAPLAGGGLWVLDRPAPGSARLWRLDRDLRVVRAGGEAALPLPPAPLFHPDPPLPGEDPCVPPPASFPTGLSLALASPPLGGGGGDVVAVAALPDGTALLLETDAGAGDSRLSRWCLGEPVAGPVSLAAALGELVGEAVELAGHDLVFAADPAPAPGEIAGTVYVATAEGNQSFAFALTTGTARTPEAALLDLVALDAYLPMRRFSGKALIEGPDAPYYDLEEVWLPLIEVPRPRYATFGRLEGLGFEGRPFDGKEPGCVWHRLFLDGCIPPGDEVVLESRAADRAAELVHVPWRREPPLHLRATGPERPFAAAGRGGDGLPAGAGTWELLFQGATGRYLELRLTLRGSGRSTPKLGALRVHYPRFSYLDRYLPPAYREDPASASFLARFLANFEGFLTELEGRVAGAEVLFDTRTAPAEALDWLATWLGAALDEGWDEARRRLFLAHAVALYRRRGTPLGLLQSIRLAVDPCPDESLFAADDGGGVPFDVRLVEAHRARRLPAAVAGDPTVPLLPAQLPAGEPWRPSQGGARLARLYADFLRRRYGAGARGADPAAEAAALVRLNAAWGRSGEAQLDRFDDLQFTPLPPAAGGGEAADWRTFAAFGLGFPYPEVSAADAPGWRTYLRQRYRRVDALNRAWELPAGRAFASFDDVALPARLPADGAPLADWFAWTTVALPVSRSAHRFTVLVPVGAELLPADRRRRLDKVRAVVERERPAHTGFDVQLYWALFRVGAARVGLDTLVGEGARFTSLVLGAGYLGEGLLAGEPPSNVRDRRVLGRDTVGPPPLS
jgi:phage tail-like protein